MRLFTKRFMKIIAFATAVVFLSGCGVFTSAVTAAKAQGLVISEVVSSNSNSLVDEVFGRPDWVELYNASDKAVSLKGYSVSNSKSSDKKYELPDITLDAGKYMVLYACSPIQNMPEGKYCMGFKLSKTGTDLVLSLNDNIEQTLSVPQLAPDISYALTQDGAYKFFSKPTPGAANSTPFYETLAEMQSGTAADISISEVLPKSTSEEDPYAWVELYNKGKTTIKLSDYYITEDISNPTKARLPEKDLKAGEYAVFKCSGGTGADELPFKISGTESSLMISNNLGVEADSLSWDTGVLPGISVGRGADNAAVYYNKPTPGAANGTDGVSKPDFTIKEGAMPVRINEILMENTFSLVDADGDRPSWVELYNTSDQSVKLNDYALSDEKESQWKFVLPDVELKSHAYIIIYLSGKNRKTGDEIHASFKLGSADKELILTSTALRTMQTATLPTNPKDNVSYGLDAAGKWMYFPQPTPAADNNTKGFTDIASVEDTGASPLKINEVMAAKQAKGVGHDWVEIYNQSASAVDLAGYYLSDSEKDLKKWPIENLKAPANGYAVVDQYKKDGQTQDLSISSSGERLFLSNPQGVVLDQYETGVLISNVSSGLSSGDKSTRAFFASATPGKQNSAETVSGYCSEPVFSEAGGCKSAPVSLTISDTTEGASIYYTTDGSTPTANSAKYTGPVQVSDTMTVRAIAIAQGKFNSTEMVATYIFGRTFKLPVICLSMTPKDLSWVYGSRVRDDRREKGGYVEYYEADGSLGVRFPAGFRIAGNGTRGMAQKSINLYMRSVYGKSSVTYPFFDNYDITTFQSLSLRNMGQDHTSRIRDLFGGMVAKGMNVDYMEGKFAAVYINGEYRGLYEFKENQNEDFLASRHNIDPNKVEMVRGNTNAIVGDNKDIKSLFSLASKNTANADTFKQYTDRADPDYFADYLIACIYLYASDFYNQKYAHTTDDKMKWRPLLYDLDSAFGTATGDMTDRFFRSSGVLGPLHEDGSQFKTRTDLYYAFYKNPEWKQQFVKRYAEVLNTILMPDKMLKTFDDLVDTMKDEMPYHIKKWGSPSSMSSWENELDDIRQVIKTRRKYAISALQRNFNLSDADMQQLFPNG